MPTVGAIVHHLEQFAPPALAAEWDNVGLLLGETGSPVQKLMTCLTVTPESAAEAIAEGAQLIVSHHPVLFRAAKRLTDTSSEGRLLLPLLRAGIAVFSPHTAFDNTIGGINDILARRLDLTDCHPLRRQPGARSCKIVVFVPDKDLPAVSDGLFAAGAGIIGKYRECSYRLAGTGTFFGTEATNPTVGEKGRREEVSEWRLEVVCPENRTEAAIAAIRRTHSYEEPAFDVYLLKPPLSTQGEGRVGSLAKPLPLGRLVTRVKKALGVGTLALVGDRDRPVQRVAIVCGAGGEMMGEAVRARADVFLTGEMRFHDCLSARAQNLALLLPGHHATERLGVEELAGQLQQRWPEVEVWASRRESDPLQWV
jgi:dinuclear metal center YbgI/SA1388 family protein